MNLQSYYNMIAYGTDDSPPPWIHAKAEDCGCRGRGWYLSDLDTWHQCPIHNTGQPHPETIQDIEE